MNLLEQVGFRLSRNRSRRHLFEVWSDQYKRIYYDVRQEFIDVEDRKPNREELKKIYALARERYAKLKNQQGTPKQTRTRKAKAEEPNQAVAELKRTAKEFLDAHGENLSATAQRQLRGIGRRRYKDERTITTDLEKLKAIQSRMEKAQALQAKKKEREQSLADRIQRMRSDKISRGEKPTGPRPLKGVTTPMVSEKPPLPPSATPTTQAQVRRPDPALAGKRARQAQARDSYLADIHAMQDATSVYSRTPSPPPEPNSQGGGQPPIARGYRQPVQSPASSAATVNQLGQAQPGQQPSQSPIGANQDPERAARARANREMFLAYRARQNANRGQTQSPVAAQPQTPPLPPSQTPTGQAQANAALGGLGSPTRDRDARAVPPAPRTPQSPQEMGFSPEVQELLKAKRAELQALVDEEEMKPEEMEPTLQIWGREFERQRRERMRQQASSLSNQAPQQPQASVPSTPEDRANIARMRAEWAQREAIRNYAQKTPELTIPDAQGNDRHFTESPYFPKHLIGKIRRETPGSNPEEQRQAQAKALYAATRKIQWLFQNPPPGDSADKKTRENYKRTLKAAREEGIMPRDADTMNVQKPDTWEEGYRNAISDLGFDPDSPDKTRPSPLRRNSSGTETPNNVNMSADGKEIQYRAPIIPDPVARRHARVIASDGMKWGEIAGAYRRMSNPENPSAEDFVPVVKAIKKAMPNLDTTSGDETVAKIAQIIHQYRGNRNEIEKLKERIAKRFARILTEVLGASRSQVVGRVLSRGIVEHVLGRPHVLQEGIYRLARHSGKNHAFVLGAIQAVLESKTAMLSVRNLMEGRT